MWTTPEQMTGHLNETGLGQYIEAVGRDAIASHEAYAGPKSCEIHDPGLEACAVTSGVSDDLAMGGECYVRCVSAQGLARLQRE